MKAKKKGKHRRVSKGAKTCHVMSCHVSCHDGFRTFILTNEGQGKLWLDITLQLVRRHGRVPELERKLCPDWHGDVGTLVRERVERVFAVVRAVT